MGRNEFERETEQVKYGYQNGGKDETLSEVVEGEEEFEYVDHQKPEI